MKEKPLQKPPNWIGLFRECRAILSLYIGVILLGFDFGFSAVAIPSLRSEVANNVTKYGNVLALSKEQESWFASGANLGQIVGCLLGGYFGNLLGPRRTIIIFCVPGFLGWLSITFAPAFALLLVGRILAGLGSASLIPNCSILVAQFSVKERRGAFLGLFTLMSSIGITLTYTIGSLLPWRFTSIVPASLYLLLALLLLLIPESPIWLLGNRGKEEAQKALEWLRGGSNVDNEITQLQMVQECASMALGFRDAIRNLARCDVQKPFLILITNMILLKLTGVFVVVAYIVDILAVISESSTVDHGLNTQLSWAAIPSGLFRIVGGIVAIFLIHRFPRKTLAHFYMVIMAAAMLLLGSIEYAKSLFPVHEAVKLVEIICVCVYTFAFASGPGAIQWVWLGELMPPEYKVLSGIITALQTVMMFLTVKTFHFLLHILQPYGIFWLFGAFCLLNNVFYATIMVETKDLSLLDIKRNFQKKDEKNSNSNNNNEKGNICTLAWKPVNYE